MSLLTFGIASVRERRFIRDVLAAAQEVALDDWTLVFQLSSESAVVILEKRFTVIGG